MEASDFGTSYDEDSENAPEYGCGNRVFRCWDRVPKGVLAKYSITKEEFWDIGEEMSERLSFGCCSYCA